MLTPEISKRINDLVYSKPRTVDEIATYLKKNWRTANRYIEKISEEQGTISMRTFREGSRGALKIVYWNNIEKIHATSFQEKLFSRIESSRGKDDFSPFDIYQYVDEKKKSAFMEQQEDESETALNKDLHDLLKNTEKQILIFSGSLSWANLKQGNTKTIEIFESLAKKNISIKVIANVDLSNLNNVNRFLSINERVGRNVIEVRHREQPLRAIVIDSKLARFKEVRVPSNKKKKTFTFYCIYDKDWIEWIQKIFWNLFSTAIPAEKRIKELETIKKIS
ncbi:MAG: hypothetical protein V1660_01040 [archaeon]